MVENFERVSSILVSTYYFAKSTKCIFNFTKSILTANGNHSVLKSTSSAEIFFKNAVWLERELREMLGVFFTFKSDNRCLLLLYGSSDYPIRKLFPSQGYRELYYSRSTDSVVAKPLGAQF